MLTSARKRVKPYLGNIPNIRNFWNLVDIALCGTRPNANYRLKTEMQYAADRQKAVSMRQQIGVDGLTEIFWKSVLEDGKVKLPPFSIVREESGWTPFGRNPEIGNKQSIRGDDVMRLFQEMLNKCGYQTGVSIWHPYEIKDYANLWYRLCRFFEDDKICMTPRSVLFSALIGSATYAKFVEMTMREYGGYTFRIPELLNPLIELLGVRGLEDNLFLLDHDLQIAVITRFEDCPEGADIRIIQDTLAQLNEELLKHCQDKELISFLGSWEQLQEFLEPKPAPQPRIEVPTPEEISRVEYLMYQLRGVASSLTETEMRADLTSQIFGLPNDSPSIFDDDDEDIGMSLFGD